MGGGIGYAVYEAAGSGAAADLPEVLARLRSGGRLSRACNTCTRPDTIRRRSSASSKRFRRKEKKKPGTLAKAFATHPQTPDRIEESQEEIATILPAKTQYIVSTSEFDDVKARLAMIENRHKVLDEKEVNKPTLRRTSNTDKSGTDKSGDDDRPTLKRRPDGDSGTQN